MRSETFPEVLHGRRTLAFQWAAVVVSVFKIPAQGASKWPLMPSQPPKSYHGEPGQQRRRRRKRRRRRSRKKKKKKKEKKNKKKKKKKIKMLSCLLSFF